tara:strand:- start:1663 stop:2268 length:606 start_codon:yes stop_codon:yes gene_type:complete
MATFKQKMEQLVGTIDSSVADTDLNVFLTNTAYEVLEIIPDKIAIRYTSDNEQSDNSGFDSTNNRVLGVIRNGFEAQEVSIGLSTQIEDADSIHFRSVRTPVYYYDNGTIVIKPDPTNTEKAQIKTIAYPTVTHSGTAITGFPDTAEYAVVLGACVKYLYDVLNTAVNIDEDIEIAQAIKLQIDSLMQLYQQELKRISEIK